MTQTQSLLDELNTLLNVKYPEMGYSSYNDIKGMGKRRSNVYIITTPGGGVTYSSLNGRHPKQTIKNIQDRIQFVKNFIENSQDYRAVVYARHKKELTTYENAEIHYISETGVDGIAPMLKQFGVSLAQTISPYAMLNGVEVFNEDILDFPKSSRFLKEKFGENADNYRFFAQIIPVNSNMEETKKKSELKDQYVMAMDLWMAYINNSDEPFRSGKLSDSILEFIDEFTETGLKYAISDIVEDAEKTLSEIDEQFIDDVITENFFHEAFLRHIVLDKKTQKAYLPATHIETARKIEQEYLLSKAN